MFLLTSLIACMILACVMPFLGRRVLERRIVFVDLALAQFAATGYAIGLASDTSGPLWAGGITVVAVLAFAALPYASKLPKEAVMGAMYAVAAAAGMVVLTQLPHAEGHMTDLMFGSLLGASYFDLAVLAALGLLAIIMLRFAGNDTYIQRVMFYMALALAVVPAIHAVGIVLVFGMLLLPALAAWQGENNGPVWQALLVGMFGAVAGVMAAEFLDLPPSSSVVLALFICGAPMFIWNISKQK
ncbi:metal ABC transporter permease [Ghiorsea bivora]|uniref:metal ABC transporter permease n=1 Tax=Ghiorsea bivora TaxID=1485545 RepID=UPI0005707032|nr:metal ABC transporter permease [Ghiorsea bivora]